MWSRDNHHQNERLQTVSDESIKKLNCVHGWRLAAGSFMPCPFCKPTEARALQGEGSTAQEVADVAARRKSSASLGNQQPSRTLDLAGKTLAGCAVGKMAVDATPHTRFHIVAACGHSMIVDGTTLVQAEKAKRLVKCKACSQADTKALKRAKLEARRIGGQVTTKGEDNV